MPQAFIAPTFREYLPRLVQAVSYLDRFDRGDKKLQPNCPAYYQGCAALINEQLQRFPEAMMAGIPLSLAMGELVEGAQMEQNLIHDRARHYPVLDAFLNRLTLPHLPHA